MSAEMSGNLRQVLICVDSMVKKIKAKRDFILSILDGRKCVDTASMTLLLNSFVDQLLDDSDVKPVEDIARHMKRDCTTNGHRSPSGGDSIVLDLRKRIKELEARVESDVADNQALHRRLQTFGAKESEYKRQIKQLEKQIEKNQDIETQLKTKINEINNSMVTEDVDHRPEQSYEERIKNQITEELNRRRRTTFADNPEEMVTKDSPQKTTEIVMDSDCEEVTDQLVKNCLTSRLSITLRPNDRVVTSKSVNGRHTITIDGDSEDGDNESTDCEADVDSSRPSGAGSRRSSATDTKRRSKQQNKYTINRSSRLVHMMYECKACPYKTTSRREVRWHTNNDCSPLPFMCHECDQPFLLERDIRAHMRYKHTHRDDDSLVDRKFGTNGLAKSGHTSQPNGTSDRQLRQNRRQTQLFSPVIPKRVKRELIDQEMMDF